MTTLIETIERMRAETLHREPYSPRTIHGLRVSVSVNEKPCWPLRIGTSGQPLTEWTKSPAWNGAHRLNT